MSKVNQWLPSCSTASFPRPVFVFTAKAGLPATNPRWLQVIPSQQRYWLKWRQRLIWNILGTMSGRVFLLYQHPAWFMDLILLLFTLSLCWLKGLVGNDVNCSYPSLCLGALFSVKVYGCIPSPLNCIHVFPWWHLCQTRREEMVEDFFRQTAEASGEASVNSSNP